AEPDNAQYPLLVEEMEFAVSQGADKPLFKVAFPSETHGYALGAYGMILETRDGGQTWLHILEKVDNDAFFHVFDLAPLPEQGKYFLSGEAGLLMVGDTGLDVANKVSTVPWEGSFFTVIDATDGSIVIGGLRGNMFRTADAGATWAPVKKGMSSAIVDSIRLADGRLVAVGIGGEVLLSADNGVSFTAAAIANRQQLYTTEGRIYAVAEGPDGTLLVGGPSGINKLTLPQ
ncbi:MAG TPA: YCF48-related protein, partial [Halioglobus sp.]